MILRIVMCDSFSTTNMIRNNTKYKNPRLAKVTSQVIQNQTSAESTLCLRLTIVECLGPKCKILIFMEEMCQVKSLARDSGWSLVRGCSDVEGPCSMIFEVLVE